MHDNTMNREEKEKKKEKYGTLVHVTIFMYATTHTHKLERVQYHPVLQGFPWNGMNGDGMCV